MTWGQWLILGATAAIVTVVAVGMGAMVAREIQLGLRSVRKWWRSR